MRKLDLLAIPALLAVGAILVWSTLPETQHYRFGARAALSGDADRGEGLDGWYWSSGEAARFAGRRLGPGARPRCTGVGRHVRSVVGNKDLYRRFACSTRFAAQRGRPFAATVRVDSRNLATVLCRDCPADPSERGELLALADRFVALTGEAIPFLDENGRGTPGHVARAERLRVVFGRWQRRNRDDATYRALASSGVECARRLALVLQAEAGAAASYNACVQRFGAVHERLGDAFGPQPPR